MASFFDERIAMLQAALDWFELPSRDAEPVLRFYEALLDIAAGRDPGRCPRHADATQTSGLARGPVAPAP
jgi:predicted enzyme related to lactoylglutathione lyase